MERDVEKQLFRVGSKFSTVVILLFVVADVAFISESELYGNKAVMDMREREKKITFLLCIRCLLVFKIHDCIKRFLNYANVRGSFHKLGR